MKSLWSHVAQAGATITGGFHGRAASTRLGDLVTGSTLPDQLESLRGRSVLIAARDQRAAAIALIELDGIAGRMVLCTPDMTPELMADIAMLANADVMITDEPATNTAIPHRVMTSQPVPATVARQASESTEWVLLTSGTTSRPKLVVHSFKSLTATLPTQPPADRCVWSTFYDIRRYGGLQMYLRAVLSGVDLVLSSLGESTYDFLTRAAGHGVTHMSGTPSHWRHALMSSHATFIKPDYVRLSGEVVDQPILDALRRAYPKAQIGHAFASTEAGVGFEVNDGLAGFPAELLATGSSSGLKIQDDTLRVRSGRVATKYIGLAGSSIPGGDGYVDTGDLIERIDNRCYFRGRRGGIINVGGLKVYPEEVEAVLNADPRVRMSLVRARRNPIVGAIVVADVVLTAGGSELDDSQSNRVKSDLLEACRRSLPAHKVPAMLRFVQKLDVTAAGKLSRPSA